MPRNPDSKTSLSVIRSPCHAVIFLVGIFLFPLFGLTPWKATAHPVIYYVKAGAADGGCGTEAAPYATIQQAVDAVNCQGGGTIHIAPGTYSESVHGIGLTAIEIFGSETGTTVVDARGAPERQMVLDITGTEDVTIKNLTISGGLNDVGFTGGGVRIGGAHEVILEQCTIGDNEAAIDGGGGVGILSGARVILRDCSVSDNHTSQGSGGGINVNGANSRLIMERCRISGNSAVGRGGALSAGDIAFLSLVDCQFSENSAPGNAGLSLAGTRKVELTGCVVAGNTASGAGGGIAAASIDTLLMTGCVVADNTAQAQASIEIKDTYFEMKNCTITGNSVGRDNTIAALNVHSSTGDIEYSILYGNENGTSYPHELFLLNGAEVTVSNSDVGTWLAEPMESFRDGGGNVNIDPEFADPDGGDYRLTCSSPGEVLLAGNHMGAFSPPSDCH